MWESLPKDKRGEAHMEYRLIIYSSDAIFSRMLEVEFSMQGLSVLVSDHPGGDLFSSIALLDLDSAQPPLPDSYDRMIGFTRGQSMADEDTRRACSMILRRPFEMQLLRREILEKSDFKELSDGRREPKIFLHQDGHAIRVNGREVRLTPKEFLVAEYLFNHRTAVVSRRELTEVIGESETNKTDVYVCLLRKKLDTVCSMKVIETVRGQGYRMV